MSTGGGAPSRDGGSHSQGPGRHEAGDDDDGPPHVLERHDAVVLGEKAKPHAQDANVVQDNNHPERLRESRGLVNAPRGEAIVKTHAHEVLEAVRLRQQSDMFSESLIGH